MIVSITESYYDFIMKIVIVLSIFGGITSLCLFFIQSFEVYQIARQHQGEYVKHVDEEAEEVPRIELETQ